MLYHGIETLLVLVNPALILSRPERWQQARLHRLPRPTGGEGRAGGAMWEYVSLSELYTTKDVHNTCQHEESLAVEIHRGRFVLPP